MTISGTSTAQPLPNDRNRVLDAFDSIGASTGSLLADAPFALGVVKETDAGTQIDGGNVALLGATGGAVAGGVAGVSAILQRTNPLTGSSRAPLEMAALGVGTLAVAGLAVTPTLVAAVAGPAIADGITAVAPKIVKKKRDVAKITDVTEKTKAEKNNQFAKYTRMAVAGVGVGAVGLAAFMIKPSLFRNITKDKLGTELRFVSDPAIKGRTFYRFDQELPVNGVRLPPAKGNFIGQLDEQQVREAIRKEGRLEPREGAELTLRHQDGIDPTGGRSIRDIPGNAVTSNRAAVAALGAAGTLGMANAAAGADENERTAMWAGTAAVAAATIGGTIGVGALTARMIRTRGDDTLLARNTALPKIPINMDTLKSYGKVISVTGVPAATSAGMYYNVFDDFGKITDTRSQFRK